MFLQRLLFLCLLAGTATTLVAETRMIHVVQMLDNNSPEYLIREGCRSIDYGVQREVERIQHALGIASVEFYQLSGPKFTRGALEFVLDYELEYQQRDIIIMVYAGHGYREPGSTATLPKLYFNGYENSMEGDELKIRLLEKNPSVLINLIVACNTTQTDRSVTPGRPQDEGLNPGVLAATDRPAAPYVTLFSDQDGYTKVIDLISSDREYETFMSRDGGVFFSEVLYGFHEMFSDQRLTDWSVFCDYVTQQTLIRSRDRHLRQKPVCSYEVYRSMDAATIVIRDEDYPAGPVNCRVQARELRRSQRGQLRSLRRTHRTELRQTADRGERRLAAARQKTERAKMRHQHLQEAQRASCK